MEPPRPSIILCNSISLNQKERCESLSASCQSRRAARRAKKKLPHRESPRSSLWSLASILRHYTRQEGGPRGRPTRRPCVWTKSSAPDSSPLALQSFASSASQSKRHRRSPRSRPFDSIPWPSSPLGREEGSMASLQRRIRRQRGTPPQRAPKLQRRRRPFDSIPRPSSAVGREEGSMSWPRGRWVETESARGSISACRHQIISFPDDDKSIMAW
ncbi:hypothetical protein PVAP13_1NG146400 [Panicum virgatum]|uniref:Uncharacterized protein n=1 Tax=Panicum virgatum TaxID=38727 RepID=A0A8T0WYB7_PANVG|nr:hypothetical protein PVAP13_1NG146400 [Panicum virgatum]KAG2649896.1 hypothetical protein PVAP13_1NG146400 [Panicum virgatum]KAG2649897.1 hypothetical protein PVAP13_1NG146400 [Panicum virgatum]KAG2649899.1 hypothetical protein PVAP13_1NG146400 [Panicum virgatum]KAG2649900.1 hypothetical protein PVAP13_1NG146400 [Panicum virgatum]